MHFSLVIFNALFVSAVLGQNATDSDSNTNTSTTAPSSGTATTFAAPTVTGEACGTTQQNFNQCVTKVAIDINSCLDDEICLCQTYANIAACYNACPDLSQGETYKQQSEQHCAQAHISPRNVSAYNTTSTPMVTVSNTTNTTQTHTSGNGTTIVVPAATASAFASSSGTANFKFELSSIVVGLAVGSCTILFA